MSGKKHFVKVAVDDDMYEKLWKITKRRFPLPCKKLSTILREALKEYIERHEKE